MATNWLQRILPQIRNTKDRKSSQVPEGLWRKCPACEAILYRPELDKGLDVCPKCDHHLRVSAEKRLAMFLDSGKDWERLGAEITQRDPLKFKDSKKYRDRLSAAEKVSKSEEALIVAKGNLKGSPVVVSVFEFKFMGGSMGTAVGARFVAGVKRAIQDRCPFICFSASGGARMQEAVLSLMQMAKVSAALEQLSLAGLPYISVMTDPVYGGVSASLAMLGDVNVAEPNALIGFTGPRVIEQTVRQKLPEGFQRSEFLLAHGSIDMIIHRHQLRDTLARLLVKFSAQKQAQEVAQTQEDLVSAPASTEVLLPADEASSGADSLEAVENSQHAESDELMELDSEDTDSELKKDQASGADEKPAQERVAFETVTPDPVTVASKKDPRKKSKLDSDDFGHLQPAQ